MPTVSALERDANPRLTFTATDPATCAVMDVWGTPPPPDDLDVAEETHDDPNDVDADSQPGFQQLTKKLLPIVTLLPPP